MISVNQLSIYGALADLRKELNKNSKEDSAEDSFEDSESSGTLYAKENLKMRQYTEIEAMPQNARCSPGGNAAISETDTSRTSTTSTTRSAIRRRRKLRLLCQSEDWMAVLQRATVKPAGSILSSTSQWPTSQGKRVGAHGSLHHLRNGGDFVFLERIPENRRGV